MNRLTSELQRLYLLPDAVALGADGLVDGAGQVRAAVLELARPADWAALSAVWQAVQTDLGLPAPGIAVSGTDGVQLWFSLARPVPAAQAAAFLEALRQRYLPEVAPHRLRLLPVGSGATLRHADLVPAHQGGSGQWSAFVAPGLAAVFGDTPWLDGPPGDEAQAEVLSGLKAAQPAAWLHALLLLGPAEPPAAPPVRQPAPAHLAAPAAAEDQAATDTDDPRRFLLRVMNDPSVDLSLRIEAAKALLPGAGPPTAG